MTQKTREEFDAAGGSTEHVALKLLAAKYFEDQGYSIVFEKDFCGYYPDVLTTDHKIVIECGHTDNIDKMFIYFTQGKIDTFVQVPYPDVDDTSIDAHVFTPSESLAAALAEESAVHKEQILAIMNQKRW